MRQGRVGGKWGWGDENGGGMMGDSNDNEGGRFVLCK